MTALEAVQPVLFDGMTGIAIKRSLPRLLIGKPYGPRKPSLRQTLFKPRLKRLSNQEFQFVLDFFLPQPEFTLDAMDEAVAAPVAITKRRWRPSADAVERQLDLLLPLEDLEEVVEDLSTDDHKALGRNVLAIHDKLIEISLHAMADDRCSDELRFEILNWIAHPGYENGVLLPFSFEACCICTGTESDEMRLRIKRMFAEEIRRLITLDEEKAAAALELRRLAALDEERAVAAFESFVGSTLYHIDLLSHAQATQE